MQEFSPVSTSKLYIQVYNQIYDAIVSGRYHVGDKLPSEKEFCSMFNVSRVPVREALCALELNGLVDSVQGVGVYVKEVIPAGTFTLSEVEPQEIIRVRITVEPDIAREAANHISEACKTELIQILDNFRLEYEEGGYTTEADTAFHRCIAKATGNSIYVSIMDMIFKYMEQDMWELILSRTIATPKYREQNYNEHKYIGEAILGGRADDAYIYMKEHMEKLYERYWGTND